MITDVTTTQTNKIIVVGMLDTMLVRDRNRQNGAGRGRLVAVTRQAGRNRETGGRQESLTLQVRSPYGGMFALPITIEPDVPGAALLESAVADTLLAVEGLLQLKRGFDARFARAGHDAHGRLDRGRPTRALQLHVTAVRAPTEQERRSSSGVWLEGVVAEPPRISRHPELPATQLAGTILRVTARRPADFPGLPATIDETVEVNVAVPTSAAQAAALYRQGNHVRIAGQLDCRMERQAGPAVEAKLAELDAYWERRRVELAGSAGELQRATRSYRQQRMRMEAAPRLYVLALGVELVQGEALALEESYEARRAFVQAQRQQREARQQRRVADQQRRAARAAIGAVDQPIDDAPGVPRNEQSEADV